MAFYNMDKIILRMKKARQKNEFILYIIPFLENSNYSDRMQTHCYLTNIGFMGKGEKNGTTDGHRETFGVINIFNILIVMMFTWVLTLVKQLNDQAPLQSQKFNKL